MRLHSSSVIRAIFSSVFSPSHWLVGFLLGLWVGSACAGADIRLGVLAWLGSEEAEVQWKPLVLALEHHLPGHRIQLRQYNLDELAEALRAGEVEFVVTNPGHYVMLEAEHGISRIATQVSAASQNPAHVVGSAVVVLEQRSDLRRLEDLRGGRLAAVAEDAFGGYQLIWAELRRHGLDPEQGQPEPLFTGFPMPRVIDAVLRGEADAGVLRACLLERLERNGVVPAGRLRVLSPRPELGHCGVTSVLYPGWAFAAARGTDPALSRAVLLVLLSLSPDEDGQAWSVPADYHPVNELFRELQIGPYAFLRETGWDSLWRRYWPLGAGIALFLLAWGIYTLRVEHLVQRRTRELSSALAERQRLEARIRTGQEQMDHLSRLSILGELSGTLAHELNQPLAAIGNYARSLLRRQRSGILSDDALCQAAEEIASESERAAGILGGIRAFARKRSRVRNRCDLAELVLETAALLRGIQAQAPAITLEDKLPAVGRQVLADSLQLQQVLLNLFKNAWDAQQAVGNADPIVVRLEATTDRCVVTVRDHGGGFTPALQQHLFEPFFTTKPNGLGLGLSICKTIIEAHGGELQAFEPDEGTGLIMCFSLPLTDAGGADQP
jgi:two-component system, LuxR family, sensor histidine kinase TtrS